MLTTVKIDMEFVYNLEKDDVDTNLLESYYENHMRIMRMHDLNVISSNLKIDIKEDKK